MWHVEHHSADAYLLGSFHILPRGVKWYGPSIEAAFEQADELVVESVDSPEEIQKAMLLLAEKSLLPDGKRLDQMLDTDTFTRLMESADMLGLDRERVARSQPWFLGILFSIESMSQNQIHKEYGVDYLFEQAADQRAMKVSGLETMSDALNSLASESLQTQIKRLQENYSSKSDQASSLNALFQAWAVGDGEAIERLMRKEMTPAEYRRVLIDRNRRWLPRVEQHLAQHKQTMIVVGAAHLVGKRSLIDLLENRGYKVTRVQ